MTTPRVRALALLAGAALLALGVSGCSTGSDEQEAAPSSAPAPPAAAGQDAALAAPAAPRPGAPAAGITVEGAGRISGRPDTLTATLGVEVERPTVQEALDAGSAGIQQVIDALTEAGVAEEDVQTSRFQVYPRYEQDPGAGEPTIRGYLVSNLLEVKIRDIDTAGDVLGAATEAAGGDARVQGIRFSLEDNQQLVTRARERAFADARARAEHYAELAGRSLGPLVSVDETFQPPVPPERFAGQEALDAAASAPVPIQPGQQEVEVRVTTVWSLG